MAMEAELPTSLLAGQNHCKPHWLDIESHFENVTIRARNPAQYISKPSTAAYLPLMEARSGEPIHDSSRWLRWKFLWKSNRGRARMIS